MNHFNFKSLAFYGVAIGSVLILFKTVSAYGETNLKAAVTMNNRYRLQLAENLPNCKKSDGLTLNILQSGIYLNASLLPGSDKKKSTTAQEKPSLTGLFQNQQINLSGKVLQSTLCGINISQERTYTPVTMQMQLVNKDNLTGQLTVSGNPKTIGFTAIAQKKQEQSENSASH
jgi:hypothetical protein